MAKTRIEWAESTWNPIIGCKHVSPGCDNCYAERMARRLAAMGNKDYQAVIDRDGRWNGEVRLRREELVKSLKWRKPRTVFVCSMSDLFFARYDVFRRVWKVMKRTPQHRYLVLTKRPERMLDFTVASESLPNVGLGTTVENQEQFDLRVPFLMQCRAAMRFVSIEPMLGPIEMHLCPDRHDAFVTDRDPEEPFPPDTSVPCPSGRHWVNGLSREPWRPCLDWGIVGGESGPGARPMDPDWVRSIRDQCMVAGVPFFFKGWGGVNKKRSGRILDGRTCDERPEGLMASTEV